MTLDFHFHLGPLRGLFLTWLYNNMLYAFSTSKVLKLPQQNFRKSWEKYWLHFTFSTEIPDIASLQRICCSNLALSLTLLLTFANSPSSFISILLKDVKYYPYSTITHLHLFTPYHKLWTNTFDDFCVMNLVPNHIRFYISFVLINQISVIWQQ